MNARPSSGARIVVVAGEPEALSVGSVGRIPAYVERCTFVGALARVVGASSEVVRMAAAGDVDDSDRPSRRRCGRPPQSPRAAVGRVAIR